MLDRLYELFRKKEPVEEPRVRISPIVRDLLAGNETSQPLSPEEEAVVGRINKLKGTQFQRNPGRILNVMETGSDMARASERDFDLNLLHIVMDGKVRRNNIPVDLDNPVDVDWAWSRYFDEVE
jgi:hypothetical protein